jgi:hypothetical protein
MRQHMDAYAPSASRTGAGLGSECRRLPSASTPEGEANLGGNLQAGSGPSQAQRVECWARLDVLDLGEPLRFVEPSPATNMGAKQITNARRLTRSPGPRAPAERARL